MHKTWRVISRTWFSNVSYFISTKTFLFKTTDDNSTWQKYWDQTNPSLITKFKIKGKWNCCQDQSGKDVNYLFVSMTSWFMGWCLTNWATLAEQEWETLNGFPQVHRRFLRNPEDRNWISSVQVQAPLLKHSIFLPLY